MMPTATTTKGHWPKGKPRSTTPLDRWIPLRAALAELLAAHPLRGVRSRRALAEHLGITDTTVCRWFTRRNVPEPQHLRRVEAWLRRQIAIVSREESS